MSFLSALGSMGTMGGSSAGFGQNLLGGMAGSKNATGWGGMLGQGVAQGNQNNDQGKWVTPWSTSGMPLTNQSSTSPNIFSLMEKIGTIQNDRNQQIANTQATFPRSVYPNTQNTDYDYYTANPYSPFNRPNTTPYNYQTNDSFSPYWSQLVK